MGSVLRLKVVALLALIVGSLLTLSSYAGTLPAVPSGVSAAAGNSQVTLRWNPASLANSYRVMRSTTSGGPYAQIAAPTWNGFTDVSVDNGTTYYYTIQAADSSGLSARSAQVSARPSGLGAPGGVVAKAGNSQVSLLGLPFPPPPAIVLTAPRKAVVPIRRSLRPRGTATRTGCRQWRYVLLRDSRRQLGRSKWPLRASKRQTRQHFLRLTHELLQSKLERAANVAFPQRPLRRTPSLGHRHFMGGHRIQQRPLQLVHSRCPPRTHFEPRQGRNVHLWLCPSLGVYETQRILPV